MDIFTPAQIEFARCIGALNYTNPFSVERISLEKAALGDSYTEETQPFWSLADITDRSTRGNVLEITDRAQHTAEDVRQRIVELQSQGKALARDQLELYEGLVIYLLFYQFLDEWLELDQMPPAKVDAVWNRFSHEANQWLGLPGTSFPTLLELPHIFALLQQVCRAFFHIFDCVLGQSLPAAQLRSQIWESIFTYDMRRYRRTLYRSMNQITSLVTGPSGSGKELVSRAIGMSRYLPFNPETKQFEASATDSYVAINISAFSVNLIESELFGHAKGAFTGADHLRAGWLESIGPHGAVLLDEIGELDPGTQVKLLRVLENREFQRLGETKHREFHGKIIAATNRDLRDEIRKGSFREDLYYRLCSDVIKTPSLAEQLEHNPQVIEQLVTFLAQRICREEHDALASEVIAWLRNNLAANYHWPGNIRELEQCVRNIMIHNCYQPANPLEDPQGTNEHELWHKMESASITADEVVSHYCKMVYDQAGSYERAAQVLGLDRRTVRAKILSIPG